MGQVKAYLADALERLQMSYDEVSGMSLVELNELLEQRENSLKLAKTEILEQIKQEQEWDVDTLENRPSICIATNKGG